MGEDRRLRTGPEAHVAGEHRLTHHGELRVAADVIGIDGRVGDALDGPLGQLPDFRDHLVADFGQAGVDEQSALIADLGHDVAALAGGDEVHVALHGQHLDTRE